MKPLHDMHCHLDFMENAAEVARDARNAGTLVFANTVTPLGWSQASRAFSEFGNVVVGFGMHPWWVEADEAGERKATAANAGGQAPLHPADMAFDDPDRTTLFASNEAASRDYEGKTESAAHELSADLVRGGRERAASQRSKYRMLLAQVSREQDASAHRSTKQLNDALQLLDEHDPAVIGEVGLDFGYQHVGTRGEQLHLFEGIARWAGRRGGKLVSVHSVKAAREAIDVLERTGALATCDCVFHWFTGPSDQLKRAVDAGCYFSCGTRMLATGKGREYVKAIPTRQLILETDAPPEQGQAYSYAALAESLEEAARAVAAIKGEDALETIAQTSSDLLLR